MTSRPDDPTEVLDEDDDEPTEHLEAETDRLEPETDRLDPETGQTDEMRTRRLAKDPPPPPPPPPPSGAGPTDDESRKRGLVMLVSSIVAALVLVGVYAAAGGLDYKPSAVADPCDQKELTDSGDAEETTQQFAFSAIDGAACDLGVSREELTRALASETSREAFQRENDLSDEEVDVAVRAGLNRAIDDAEKAGVISGLAVTGLRAAAQFVPVDQLIPLIESASSFFNGENANDVGGLIDGVIDSLGGGEGDTGTTGDTGDTKDLIPDDLGNQIEKGLTDQLPESIQKNLPDDLQAQAEEALDQLINP